MEVERDAFVGPMNSSGSGILSSVEICGAWLCNQHRTLLSTGDVAVAQRLHPAFLRQFYVTFRVVRSLKPGEEVQMDEQTQKYAKI